VTSATAPTTIEAPSLGTMLAALLRADLVVLTKNKMRLLLSLLLPIIILSTTNSSKATRSFGGAAFVLGLAITSGIAGTSIMGYAPMAARDRENGVFQRLRVSPAPTWVVMASRLSVQMASNFVIALVVLVLGDDIHHLSLSAEAYVLVLLVSVLGSAVFLAVAQALVGLVKSADTVQAFGRLLYIGLVMLGLFGATGELGGFWDTVSRWTPVGALMKVFAGVVGLGSFGLQAWLSLLACGGYALALTTLGIYWFRFDSQ
jgi:ABC-2 type transport system permease protein